MEKKLQNIYLAYHNLLIAQGLWQTHHILVNNLSEGIHKIKCKCGHNYKKCETCGITYKVCDCFLEYTKFKDDLIGCNCLCCNNINKSLMKS